MESPFQFVVTSLKIVQRFNAKYMQVFVKQYVIKTNDKYLSKLIIYKICKDIIEKYNYLNRRMSENEICLFFFVVVVFLRVSVFLVVGFFSLSIVHQFLYI
jgi:hypothetical protein